MFRHCVVSLAAFWLLLPLEAGAVKESVKDVEVPHLSRLRGQGAHFLHLGW